MLTLYLPPVSVGFLTDLKHLIDSRPLVAYWKLCDGKLKPEQKKTKIKQAINYDILIITNPSLAVQDMLLS